MPSKHPTSTAASPSPLTPAPRWIGGVVRPRGFRHQGKPMRVAAWIDSGGSLLAAAIVEGHGPTVLRQLLDELLITVDDEQRPRGLTVWPSAGASFSNLEYPVVSLERDRFLTVVIEDEADDGQIPGYLPVRAG